MFRVRESHYTAHSGGEGGRQMLTLADKGGKGFWLLMISLKKLIKIAKYIGFSQTHLNQVFFYKILLFMKTMSLIILNKITRQKERG